jgi:uncharacterized protein (TIGR02246 family)
MTERLNGSGDAPIRSASANGSARDGHLSAESLAAYVDEELESGSLRQVERHVAGCTACQDSVRVQRNVRDRLRQEPAPAVPFALRDRVFAAMRDTPVSERADVTERAGVTERAERRRPMGRLAGLALRPAWAVAAMLAVAALGYSWVRLEFTRDALPGGREQALAGASADSAAIVQLIVGHAAAWNARDARAAAALLTEDAVWVTSTGVELRGRDAIELAHVQWFDQDAATGGTTHTHPPGSISVRVLQPDVAVADLEGQFALPAADEQPPTVVERARIFIVATRDGDGWRIAQLRNMRRQGAGPTPR